MRIAAIVHGDLANLATYLEGLWRYYSRKGWFQEATFALDQANTREEASVLQHARWQRWLGEAYYQLGNLAESRRHLEQTMAWMRRPLPTTRLGWTATLSGQLLRQALHRLWPARFIGRPAAQADFLLEGVRALGQLEPILYFADDPLPFLTGSLAIVNLAEQAAAPAERAWGYSELSLACGGAGLHRVAQLYSRLASEIVESSPQPAAKRARPRSFGNWQAWPAASRNRGRVEPAAPSATGSCHLYGPGRSRRSGACRGGPL
jgi:hypothetical protein